MAPAADFNFSPDALRETYLFSNIAPQLPELNRGQWAQIEAEVRTLASSGAVRVLTFPADFGDRRAGRVSVPSNFWKIAWGPFGVRVWKAANILPARVE